MKVLIAERGAFTPEDRSQLEALGFNVVYCYTHAIDSIKSASDVPLRDHFAAAALQGICASDTNNGYSAKSCALQAYQCADAMLAEREKSK